MTEQEFHNIRQAFYIDEEIVWISQGLSHKEYFNSINCPNFIETKVRGYIINDSLSLYKGSDFSIPNDSEIETALLLFNKFDISIIKLGCIIGKAGDIWEPIKILKKEK